MGTFPFILKIMPTILDVAKKAKVSKSTVSRVVSRNGYVNAQTRKKVEAAMKTLHYTPDFFAQAMRSNKTFTIGVLIPDFTNPYFAECYKRLEERLSIAGYISMIGITRNNPEIVYRYINEMTGRKVDALIVWLYHDHPTTIDKLMELSEKIPVVFMDGFIDLPNANIITSNNYKGIQEAMELLIRQGKEKIAFIRGDSRYAVTNERYEAYIDSLKKHKIPFNADYVFEGLYTTKDGYCAAQQFMSLRIKPDAIMAATDFMALGALQLLNEKKINVPHKISLIGFDNILLGELISPKLSTIAIPIEKIIDNTCEYIFSAMENNSFPIIKKFIDCELILRETTE